MLLLFWKLHQIVDAAVEYIPTEITENTTGEYRVLGESNRCVYRIAQPAAPPEYRIDVTRR